MRAPEAALYRGLAHQQTLFVVDALDAVEIAREDPVLVAGEDGVDAVHAGEEQRGVFHHLGLDAVDPRMRKRDDDIGAVLLHLRNPGLGRLDDVAGHDVADEMARIPRHDLRRDEADEADAHGLLLAGTVGHGFVEDDIGLHVELVVARIGREFGAVDQIGADDRVVRAGIDLVHEGQAVVEFVVAERAAVISEHIHRLDHRMDHVAVHAAFIGDPVAHRIALQVVAIVDQHRVGRFLAETVDDRGGAGEAHRVVRLVGVIVIGKHRHVDVGRFHDAQMRLVGLRPDGEGMQRDDRACRRRAGQQRAAGNRMQGNIRVQLRHGIPPLERFLIGPTNRQMIAVALQIGVKTVTGARIDRHGPRPHAGATGDTHDRILQTSLRFGGQ